MAENVEQHHEAPADAAESLAANDAPTDSLLQAFHPLHGDEHEYFVAHMCITQTGHHVFTKTSCFRAAAPAYATHRR